MYSRSLGSNEGRSTYWDNAKGFLIVLVLIGHFTMAYPQLDALWNTIYFFHMPAFLFISGYFSKRSSIKTNKILKLLLLFIVFNIILMIGAVGLHPSRWAWGQVHLSAWYLLALLLYRLTIPFLEKTDNKLILSICICVGCVAGIIHPRDSLMLNKILSLYAFFVAGYFCYHNKKWKNYILQHSSIKVIISILILILLGILGWYTSQHEHISRHHLVWGTYDRPRDLIIRIILYFTGAVGTCAVLWLTPHRKLPFITTFGRNSLILFILHRPIVQILERFVPAYSMEASGGLIVLLTFFATLIICNLPPIVQLFNSTIELAIDKLIRLRLNIFIVMIAVGVCISSFGGWYVTRKWKRDYNNPGLSPYDLITIDEKKKNIIKSSFRISFVGDLILLRPQVQRGATTNVGFDFSPLFQFTKKYFLDDDCTIAVWEGPCAGNSSNYSNTAFGDKSYIRLNFPDEFATAAHQAGVDFVSLATNHVLDCGNDATERTIQILDKNHIKQVGVTPPNSVGIKQPRHQIITLRDDDGATIRVAVLAYTYGSNYIAEESFFTGENKNLVSVLVSPNSPHYKAAKQQVIQEITEAKKDKPDCLIIMPHMGTQFLHGPDDFQKHWCKVFAEAGADVILSDHPHATQPCEWQTYKNGHTCLAIHCPGNYANSYTDMDGDAVAITEIYLNKKDGKPQACGVIPMWVVAQGDKQYIPAPLPEYLYGEAGNGLSNMDWKRLDEVSKIITKSMLGVEIPLYAASTRYYTFADTGNEHVYRDTTDHSLPEKEIAGSTFIEYLKTFSKICFVGDSITEGSKNMGYGWYEPLVYHLKDVHCTRFAKGGWTSKLFLSNADKIAEHKADLYVMAYGTNDVRYRNNEKCAMTATDYIKNTSQLVDIILQSNPNARFVFIAPWPSDIDDHICKLNDKDKIRMMAQYSKALKQYCDNKGYGFIDPTSYITPYFDKIHLGFRWLIDDIHPNSSTGNRLYSRAVIKSAPQSFEQRQKAE